MIGGKRGSRGGQTKDPFKAFQGGERMTERYKHTNNTQ